MRATPGTIDEVIRRAVGIRASLALGMVACGEAAPSHDAASTDAFASDALAADAPTGDAAPRAAVLIFCDDDAIRLVQYRAEVTDPEMGYVPTGDATLDVGHVAQWVNAGGGVEHTITSGHGGPAPVADGLFASGVFVDHGTFICVRFDAPGAYPYHCAIHPDSAEQGLIEVP